MKLYIKQILIFIFLFGVQHYTLAGRIDRTNSIRTASPNGTPVTVGTPLAKDSVSIDSPLAGQVDYAITNRISFGVDVHYPEYVADSQHVKVSVHLARYDASLNFIDSFNVNLHIDYYHADTLHSYILDQLEYTDAYKLVFRIDTVWVNNIIQNTLPKNLFVEANILGERYTPLASYPYTGSFEIKYIDKNNDTKDDGIKMSWPEISGAEEYQVEFFHVTNYGKDGTVIPESQLKYDFKHNSTRITTTKKTYTLGLIFDRGWVAFRVRPVGVDVNNPSHLIYGDWSYPNYTGTVEQIEPDFKLEITNNHIHEGLLNWQYSATYAEQGKRKEVVTYFDGTLRSRQKVTKLNTNNNVVVGETVYDYLGRKAIVILPSPVVLPNNTSDEASIQFYPSFNENMNQQPYSKGDITFVSTDSTCTLSAGQMINTSGASLYYSPNNPNQELYQANVPDAAGYPFQQIEYTHDNTGRIKKKGGVGQKFQIGQGHATKYIYGQPNQLELNRMFGSEVGYAGHYRKNMVIDPNGQVAISYLDMSDKVIATALAGASPNNVTALSSLGQEVTVAPNLIHGNNQEVDLLDNSVSFNQSFILTQPSNVVIRYDLLTIPMMDSCLDNICIDCVYNLQLSLKNDCGENLLADSLQNIMVGNFQVDSAGGYVFHGHCVDSTNFNISDTLSLPLGKYTISKVLTINEDAVNSYIALADSSSCVLQESDFVNAAMQNVDSAACDITCDNCLENLGTLEDFIAGGLGTANDYYTKVQACEDLCDNEPVSKCETYLKVLELDMLPGGQYGLYQDENTFANDTTLPLSIFNVNNALPDASASWRHPKYITANGDILYAYLDANGDSAKVYLTQDVNNPGVYQPAPLSTNAIKYDPVAQQYYIYPQELNSVLDFINYYQTENSWDASLVVYHPEYCYYNSCISFERNPTGDTLSSSDFDNLLLSANSFQEAMALGLVNQDSTLSNWFSESNVISDPFYVDSSFYLAGACKNYAQVLRNKFNHFSFRYGQWFSMEDMAAYGTRCGANFPSTLDPSCIDFGGAVYNSPLDTVILNKEWQMVKSMYLSAKQVLQQELADCRAIHTCNAYNGCIGNEDYTGQELLFANSQNWSPGGFNIYLTPFFDHSQPCSFYNYQLYKDKTKRFIKGTDLKNSDANNVSYQMFQQTGQCPNAFALQNLLGELTQSGNLWSPSFDLNSTNYLAALFLANNSMNNPGTIPPLEYSADTSVLNTLTATWTDVSTNTVFATLTLHKPSNVYWSSINNLFNLYATGLHTFEVGISYLVNDTTVADTQVTGEITYFELQGCTFEQVCEPNQLATDLTTVLNLLNANGDLLSTTPIDLTTFGNPSNPINLVTLYIKNAANAGSNLSFEYLPSLPGFKISNSGGNGLYIKITNNASILAGGGLGQISTIDPTGTYSFEMDATASNAPSITLSGIMYQIHNGDTIGISAGDCHLPTPIQCEGQEYNAFKDLQPLLKDELLHYSPTTGINLFASIYTTPTIVSEFANGVTETTSSENGTGDTLTISGGGCAIVLNLDANSQLQFNNLQSVGDFHLMGDLNLYAAYTHFYCLATALVNNVTITDTIYGSTCFSLKACNTCGDSIENNNSSTIDFSEFEVPIEDAANQTFSMNTQSGQGIVLQEEDCKQAYKEYLDCVKHFNINFNGGYKIEPLSEEDFDHNNLCDCVRNYCLLLNEIVANNITFSSFEDFLTFTDPVRNCKGCDEAYHKYLEEIDRYNAQTHTYKIQQTMDELLFVAYNYCDCIEAYHKLLDSIIENKLHFHSQAEFDEFVALENVCNQEDPCMEAYNQYISCVEQFNANYEGDYTIEPLEFIDFKNNNLCDCVDNYCNLLNEIVTNNITFSSSEDFLTFTDPVRNCKGCDEAYSGYSSIVNDYNANTNTYTITPMDKLLFVGYGYCNCVEKYGVLLDGIIDNNLQFDNRDSFDLYVNLSDVCDGLEDTCSVKYYQYLHCVNHFNANYEGGYTISAVTQQTFYVYKMCECLDSYCILLNAILADDIQFSNWADFREFVNPTRLCRDCHTIYLQYVDQVNSFNNQYAGNYQITPMSEVLFTAYDYCDCLDGYIGMLTDILDQNRQFDSQNIFDYYTSLGRVCSNDTINGEVDPCMEAYEDYYNYTLDYNTVAGATGLYVFDSILPVDIFDSLKLCGCLASYKSALDAIENGLVTFENSGDLKAYVYAHLDCDRTPPCTPAKDTTQNIPLPEVEVESSCIETQVNLAVINGQNAYNQYIDSVNTVLRQKYVSHCLKTQEKLFSIYNDRQYHYTLYYYDQAGKLIKTIPPAGVELLPVTSSEDSLNIKVNEDRANGTHTVFTTHHLQTRYEYNSLGQLVTKYTPDTDPMDAFDIKLTNGLNAGLITNKIQMINGSLGYLAGEVNGRGYLYKTTDGGNTWQRVTHLVAADLKKVKMFNSVYGFAIGQAGTVLKTEDGGNSWDMMITWGTNGMIEQLNDINLTIVGTDTTLMVVGNNGLVAKCSNPLSSSPTFTIVNNGISGNVLGLEVVGDKFYATSYDPMNTYSRFYSFDAVNNEWEQIEKVNTTNFSAIDYFAQDKAYAADNDGRIYYNNNVDGGTNSRWIHVSSNLNNKIKDIAFFNEQEGVAIVSESGEGKLYRTIDGGTNWTALSTIGSYNTLSISGDNSLVIAGGNDGKLTILFPYQSGVIANQFMNVQTNQQTTDITAVWISKLNNGKRVVVFTDQDKIWFTANVLASSTSVNWNNEDYAGQTSGNIIREIKADLQTAGTLSGVVVTAGNKAWRLSGDVASTMQLAQFTGFNYFAATKGSTSFYLASLGGSLRKADFSSNPQTQNVGNLPFTVRAIDMQQDHILVSDKNTGKMAVLELINGGTALAGNPDIQTERIYPDKITGLATDNTNTTLYAYGKDGLIYRYDNTNGSFNRLDNPANNNIYDVDIDNNTIYFVGGNGMAKRATVSASSITSLNDLMTYASIPVKTATGEKDLKAIDVSSTNKAYIAGADGALLYAANIYGGFHLLSIGNIDFESISEVSNNGNVLIAGENGTIIHAIGNILLNNDQIFIPPVEDIHFNDGAKGTLIANDFVVRTTADGGGSWQIVRPQFTQSPAANYTKTWTLENNKSLLFGNGNVLVNDWNTHTTTTAFNANDVRCIAKKPNSNMLYFVDGNQVKKVDLTSLSTPQNSVPLSPSAVVNAMHVFGNGDFIVVGDNGLYKHYNNSGNLLSSNGPATTQNLNDIHFYDHINGVIVGDFGTYYKTTNQQITPSGFLQTADWEQKDMYGLDPDNVTGADINTLAYVSSTRLLTGGKRFGQSITYPYVRKITDEGDRYSQKMYYDRLGRLIVSKNSKQEPQNKYSYTLYDALGRVVEAGVKQENTGPGSLTFKDIFGDTVNGYYSPKTISDAKYRQWISDVSGKRLQVTHSYYSNPVNISNMPSVITSAPMNTQRMRIVSVTYEDTLDNNPATYASATHYVYDIHGNVKTLIRDNRKMATKYSSLSNFEFKRIDYSYDLISGNVNEVTAQNGKADQWHQAYIYDADNRIKAVYTNTHKSLMSNNKLLGNRITAIEHNSDWQKDAMYYYYDHGPLARVEIGENALQGVDYYYTLQGWLKGVNSSTLNSKHDPGSDSNQDSINANFAKDVVGFGLSYYTGDYKSISGATPIAQIQSGSQPDQLSADLYNGNIRFMQTALTNPETRDSMPMLNAYRYDQLNRLSESRSWEDGLVGNTWNPTSYDGKYHNAFTYDAMGNILTQQRNKRNGTQIEDLTYRYDYNSSGDLISNRLYHVNDNIAANVDSTDIDDMGTFDSNNIKTNNNYRYNASGQLVQDNQEQIDTIIWTAAGKVKKILRTAESSKKNLTFDYGPMGNRIAKHVYNNQTGMLESSTYYLLDAQGNQLSMYKHVVDTATATASYYLTERNIYGSSRLGTVKDTVNMQNPSILPSYGVLGNRKYALTNHLNNVLTVISDVVYPISSDNTTIDGYEVGISSVTDYSPFGVELDGRSFSNNKFRYSFQNQEVDKETGLVNYKYRMHNPLLGRFLSIDPLSRKYPWNSSYAFSENRVINSVEMEGLEATIAIVYVNSDGTKDEKNETAIFTASNKTSFQPGEFSSLMDGFLYDLGLNADDYKPKTILTVYYNIEDQKLVGTSTMVEVEVSAKHVPKKVEKKSNWERNGPLGLIIGDKYASEYSHWEHEQAIENGGKAPLPLRVLVKLLPGPGMVDAGNTLFNGTDMMSPERGEVTGTWDRYISPIITLGTGGLGMPGVFKTGSTAAKANKILDAGNSITGEVEEVYDSYEESKKDDTGNSNESNESNE